MQQTEKYKLNLIESSDPFLPEALNQNTQKLEDALSAAIEEHQAETDARLAVVEAHKLAAGLYMGKATGNSSSGEMTIALGFTPLAAFVRREADGGINFVNASELHHQNFRIVENGFRVSGDLCRDQTRYYYFALT